MSDEWTRWDTPNHHDPNVDEVFQLRAENERLRAVVETERTINLASGCPDCGVHHGCNQVVAERDRLRYALGQVATEKEAFRAENERLRAVMEANPEALARRFHETYEALAPRFGYETRRESAVPWDQVPENNRRLMVAVCAALLDVSGDMGDDVGGHAGGPATVVIDGVLYRESTLEDPDDLITEHGTIFVPVDPDAMPASAGAAPENGATSFRFIPPSCPTCGAPHTLARKFNGGDPIAFYQPDCDCDDDPEDDPAVFPVYMSGTIVGPVEWIVAADHALDDEVGTYEVETHIDPDPPGFTPDPETTRRMADECSCSYFVDVDFTMTDLACPIHGINGTNPAPDQPGRR